MEQGPSLQEKARALLTCLRPAYWQALIVVSLLYFARFDASFITLRAKTVRPRVQSHAQAQSASVTPCTLLILL